MSDCAEGANDHPVNHSAKKKKKRFWGEGSVMQLFFYIMTLLLYHSVSGAVFDNIQ